MTALGTELWQLGDGAAIMLADVGRILVYGVQ